MQFNHEPFFFTLNPVSNLSQESLPLNSSRKGKEREGQGMKRRGEQEEERRRLETLGKGGEKKKNRQW